MPIRFEHELDRLSADLGKLKGCVMAKAGPMAANRVLGSVRAVAVKELARETGAKAGSIRGELVMRKARRGDLVAYLDATAARAKNLAGFVLASQAVPPAGIGKPQFFRKRSKAKVKRYLKKGVKAKAWNKPKVYGGSFIARGAGGNVVVLVRQGSGRNASLKALRGPSIRTEFLKPNIQRAMSDRATVRIPIELDRAIRQAVKRCGVSKSS